MEIKDKQLFEKDTQKNFHILIKGEHGDSLKMESNGGDVITQLKRLVNNLVDMKNGNHEYPFWQFKIDKITQITIDVNEKYFIDDNK